MEEFGRISIRKNQEKHRKEKTAMTTEDLRQAKEEEAERPAGPPPATTTATEGEGEAVEGPGQQPPSSFLLSGGESALSEAAFDRVRTNLVGILQQGFQQIESAGFDNDERMQEDWEAYKAEVEEFFRSAKPDDPLFREKLREMTTKFAKGTN